MKTCLWYSYISWPTCYSLSPLLDVRKATEREESPSQHLKSIPQPSPNHLSCSYCKQGAKGGCELPCHIYRPFFNFRTLLLNFNGMISDVQQQQEEEHNWSQESPGMQSHPSSDATSPAMSEHQFIGLVQSLQCPHPVPLPPPSSLLNPYKSVQTQFAQDSLFPSTHWLTLGTAEGLLCLFAEISALDGSNECARRCGKGRDICQWCWPGLALRSWQGTGPSALWEQPQGALAHDLSKCQA